MTVDSLTTGSPTVRNAHLEAMGRALSNCETFVDIRIAYMVG